jgi:hypothetical protein
MGAHLYISSSGSKEAQASAQDHLTLFHLAFVFLQSCLCDVVFRYNSSPTRAVCVYVRVVISPLQNNKVCLSLSVSRYIVSLVRLERLHIRFEECILRDPGKQKATSALIFRQETNLFHLLVFSGMHFEEYLI